MYTENGVIIETSNLVHGKTAKLTYTGNLYQQGAEEIYVHLGFGLLWENLKEVKMTKTDSGFESDIPIEIADTLNFCLRDNWNNWDNNSYQNYSYEVARQKEQPRITPDSIETMSSEEAIMQDEIMDAASIINETPVQAYADMSSSSMHSAVDAVESVRPVEFGQSLIPTIENEFSQFRRLPESYLRNKKMRIMFYRLFAYVPRLLTGYTRKRARTIFKNRTF